MFSLPVDVRLSRPLACVCPSATGAITDTARHRKEQGRPVISLSADELDVDTPAHVRQATMPTPQGATIANDTDLATYLLEHGGVAVVPGTTFGLAPYIRLAYALSDADLNVACEQIVAACKRLVPD